MSTTKVQNENGEWVETDYTTIDDPFDSLTLTRDESFAIDSGGATVDNSVSGSQNDISESITQIGSQLTDLVISNSIKSSNYIPGTQGFLIDGSPGIIECASIRLTGGSISYGKNSFTDTANTGYYIGKEGVYFGSASDATKFKFSIATGALEYAGNLVNGAGQIVMNSVSQEILKDFDFGSTDYAGAVKTGDITWDGSGIVTSGTGVAVYRGGIVGANAGAVTFSISATTGSAYFSGDIEGSSITGGTLQTSTSGQRIRIISASATDPAQSANSLAIIAMDGATPYSLLDMGSDGSSVFRITMNGSTAQSTGMNIVRNSATATTNLIQVEITNVSDTGNICQLTGYGDGKILYIRNYGEIEPAVSILNAGNGSVTTYGLKIASGSNSNAPCLYVEHDAVTPQPAVYFNNYRNNNGSYPLKLDNQDVTQTHFKKIIELETCTIWISDGTTPHDNLGYDHVGDVCFSCDGGKAYYATGGADNWTAM